MIDYTVPWTSRPGTSLITVYHVYRSMFGLLDKVIRPDYLGLGFRQSEIGTVTRLLRTYYITIVWRARGNPQCL